MPRGVPWRLPARREPATLATRVRRLFVVFSLVGLAVLLLANEGAPIGPAERVALLVMAAALVWLGLRHTPNAAIDISLVASLAVIALIHDGRMLDLLFSAAFLAVLARAMYGSRRGVFAAATAYLVILEANQVVAGGWTALVQADAVIGQFGMLLPAWAMSTLVRLLHTHEERVHHERVLQRVGSDLLTSGTRDAVYHRAVAALAELVVASPGAVATLWKRNGDALDIVLVEGRERGPDDLIRIHLADVPSHYQAQLEAGESVRLDVATSTAISKRIGGGTNGVETLSVPVMQRGEMCAMFALAVEALPDSLPDAVGRLATTVALALDRTDAEAMLAGVLDSSSDTIALVDLDGRFVMVTNAVERTFGFTEAELVGQPLDVLLDVPAVERVYSAANGDFESGALECRVRHGEGGWREAEITMSHLTRSDLGSGVVMAIRDVTERRALQAEIAYRAYHDPLTGFANRALFSERLERALQRSARTGTAVAVGFLDIDDFKMVNDSLGHMAGDQLLTVAADRVRASLRQVDTAARFGGDEFALLMEDLPGADEAQEVMERLLAALRQPCLIGEREMILGVSAGLRVVGAGSDVTVADLLRDADLAMYQAKGSGKNRLEIFVPSMHTAAVTRLEMRADLQVAQERNEFVVVYQPIVSLPDGHPVGVEALLRWNHPERGLVPPAEFLYAAEELGVLLPVGRWLISEVCRQVRQWDDVDPGRRLSVAVNLSQRQLTDPLLCGTVQEALDASGLAPDRLVLEITEETVMVDRVASAAVLCRLRSIGVRLAIDDFGDGYSSLGYLRTLPIDLLKIDKSFIDDCADNGNGAVLTEVILLLADRLDMVAIAEGIEHPEQAEQLAAWGCPQGQGYLFARPLDAAALESYLLAAARPAEQITR